MTSGTAYQQPAERVFTDVSAASDGRIFFYPCGTDNPIKSLDIHIIASDQPIYVSTIYHQTVFYKSIHLYVFAVGFPRLLPKLCYSNPVGYCFATSLPCKETRKVMCLFDRRKAKKQGLVQSDDRSKPCFSGIFLY